MPHFKIYLRKIEYVFDFILWSQLKMAATVWKNAQISKNKGNKFENKWKRVNVSQIFANEFTVSSIYYKEQWKEYAG